jgi:hypothetical protein
LQIMKGIKPIAPFDFMGKPCPNGLSNFARAASNGGGGGNGGGGYGLYALLGGWDPLKLIADEADEGAPSSGGGSGHKGGEVCTNIGGDIECAVFC